MMRNRDVQRTFVILRQLEGRRESGYARAETREGRVRLNLVVQGFAQDISADLDCALEAVRQKDLPTARQALAEGAELCDTMRETMSHLLRTADYTELEAALRAADGYLEQQAAEEALGELRRAQVEVERLEWLARRLV